DPSSPIARSGILVPPGVLNQNSAITVGQVQNTPPLLVGIGGIAQAVHFGPEGQTFLAAITLQLPYTAAELQAVGLSGPEELDVYTLNTDTGEWHLVADPVEVDEPNKLIKVHVSYFSIYRIGYEMPPCLGDSEPDGDVDGTDLWEFIDGGSYS